MRSQVLPLLLCATIASAQQLPLDSVIALAQRHQRYSDSRAVNNEMGAAQLRESGNSWYPQLTLNAQSTYQNEQIAFPATLPGFSPPGIPLNFNRVLVNFSQTIYDGETTRARKEIDGLATEQQDLALAGRELEVRAQVTQRYMAVLLSEAQADLLDLRKNTLSEQRDRVSAAFANGAALASDQDALDAELLSIDQEMTQVRYTVERLRNELSVLTGDTRLGQADFVAPPLDVAFDGAVDQRPDIRAFDLRLRSLDAQEDMALAARMPKLRLFGNAGAGDPGYNTFNDAWRPMFLAGVSLDWRILDWGSRKRSDRMIDLQRSLVQQDRDRLMEQWTIALSAQERNALQFRELMQTDDRLVALRAQVSAAKSEQLTNGTITSSDYITELNREHAARLNKEVHALQAALASRTYLDLQAR